jgi:hypothetical protein
MPIQTAENVSAGETSTVGTIQEPLTLVNTGCGFVKSEAIAYPAQSRLVRLCPVGLLKRMSTNTIRETAITNIAIHNPT